MLMEDIDEVMLKGMLIKGMNKIFRNYELILVLETGR